MKGPGDIFIIMDVPTQMRGGEKVTPEISSGRNEEESRTNPVVFNVCLYLRSSALILVIIKYGHWPHIILYALLLYKDRDLPIIIHSLYLTNILFY